MKIDEQMVRHVAKLAHLRLSDAEVIYYKDQLAKVLGYVDQLSELKSVAMPAASDKEISTTERADAVIKYDILEAALSQAPQHIGTAFQVPRIIE